MLRDTMISTMPVAMIAIDALWTDRFHRLRAVRKSPPDHTWKPTQMTASATTMPKRRTSISVDAARARALRRTPIAGGVAGTAVVSAATGNLAAARALRRRTGAAHVCHESQVVS